MVHILSKNMLKKLARASAVENDSVSDGLTCKEQLHQQKSFITNMKTFHKALKCKKYQCYVPRKSGRFEKHICDHLYDFLEENALLHHL